MDGEVTRLHGQTELIPIRYGLGTRDVSMDWRRHFTDYYSRDDGPHLLLLLLKNIIQHPLLRGEQTLCILATWWSVYPRQLGL